MHRYRSLIKVTIFLLISLYSLGLSAQTDSEFWFVVPEITINHGTPGGRPAYLRFATDTTATITVSMPANRFDAILNPTGFKDIVIPNIPQHSSYSLDLSDFIAKTNGLGTWVDQNILENKPPTFPTEVNKKGLYIKSEIPGTPGSKSLITAYYEVNNSFNGEIWALKGKNALGTNFYVPFQQLTANGDYGGAPDGNAAQPYSSIEIVATMDGTTVNVTPPTNDAEYCVGGIPITAGTTKIFTLNKGETITIFPKNSLSTTRATQLAAQQPGKRLAGTHVTSNKPIAISLKDDSINHTSGSCKDALGDQLIPVNVAGVDYICNRTFLNTEDNVIVVATQNLTDIYVNDVKKNGAALNAGQQFRISLNPVDYPLNFIKISSRPNSLSAIYRPIIVYHIGGFGCEVGAAVVPPIDVCTGSTSVSFSRSNATPFYLTMMVRLGAQDGFSLDGILQTNANLIKPSDFVLVPGTSWMVARFGINPAGISLANINVGQHKITNSKDVFHLGIINGDLNTTCWFGYFSDFNIFNPPAFVVETGSTGGKLCYGSSVQLFSSGGTHYSWSPDDFLSNPNVPKPFANFITKSIKYTVTISGVCNLTATRDVNLIVASQVEPKFTTDLFSGCAPFTFNIINTSIGSGHNFWDLNSDGDFTDLGEGENNAGTFPITFDNVTNDTIRQKITLVAWDPTKICSKSISKTVLIYPRISASLTAVPADPKRCHLLSVTFNNTSTANGSSYSWDFGDGGSSYDKNPIHVYNNFNLGPTTYNGTLQVTDKYNYCKVSAPLSVLVQPYIKASFVIDKVEGCSPFNVTVLNDSKGGVDNYYWDRDGDIATGPLGFEYSVPTATGWTLPYTNGTVTNTPKPVTIKLKVTNSAGCSDIATRIITIDPPVTATFSTNNNGNPLGCAPLALNFTSTSTTNATIFHWLVDGTTIDNKTFAADTFNNFGSISITKAVTFTASNQYGCTASQTENIIVQPFVKADIALDKKLGCSPLTVNFINTSSIGASTFQWDFENNGTIEFTTKNIAAQVLSNPSITLGVRIIPIKLTASNAGCTSSKIDTITVNPQSTNIFAFTEATNLNHCSPFTTNFTSSVTNTETYQWEFGLYGASTIGNPSFLFTNDAIADVTVPVSLKTNNSFGCSAISSQNIVVKPSVKALFSLDKTAGCPPYDANVNASASAGPIISYTWDFDGIPFSGPIQLFTNPTNLTGLNKTRKIKLTVGSGFCSDTISKKIVVYPQVHALYTALPSLTGCSPITVNFQNSSVLYGSGVPVNNIVWNFKDNSSSIVPLVSHTFVNPDNTLPKTFNVSLIATTDKGCKDSVSIPVIANPRVIAAFNAQIIKQCTPMQIQITNTSFASPTISNYSWNFNGGTPAIPPNNNSFIVEYSNPDLENPVNRTINLSITNDILSGGCTNSTSQTFVIDPQVKAGIKIALPLTGGGLPIDRLCAPANFTFGNLSTGGSLSYTWNFKDGDVQTVFNRSNILHLFENRTAVNKTFNVNLTAANTKGCIDSIQQAVIVYPEVDAKFSMTRDSSCTPFYIKLKDESLNGKQWSWDFGYGGLTKISTISGETFTQIIDNIAIPEAIKKYKINLQLDDLGTGCKDTISQFIEVHPRVISNFTVSPISGCSPTTVTFSNSPSVFSNYLWELDNGLSFNQPVPAPFSISNASTVNEIIVNVKLTATNVLGCKAVSRKTVTVAPDVIASFTSSIIEGCDPFTANFSNLTPSTAYDYSWTVDGAVESTSQDYINRTFSNLSNPPVINQHNVQLKSTYKLNPTCFDTYSKIITVNPRVYPNFSFTNPNDCHPLITNISNGTVSFNSSTTYTWDLGNGTFSTLTNLINQQYKNNSATKDTTYNIKLTARSVHQCVDEITKSVTVHPRPIASYMMNNESLKCSPFDVELHNLSTGTDLSYTFNLDDPPTPAITTVDKAQVITYTYHNLTNDVKPYTISLNATTAFGCTNSTSQTVYAYPEVTANFSFAPGNAACSPFIVALNNTTNNGYFYEWGFNDGTNSNLMSPSHRFVNATENDKIFKVYLKSISAYDCEDTISFPLTVYATPVANFSVNPPLQLYPNATFNFHNQSNPAADSWIYSWTFGDGYTSSAKEAGDHTYATWGPKSNDFIYNSTLKVDAPHCSSTTSNILRLLPAEPIPYFTADIYKSCSPLEIHPINISKFGENYVWDFGDGTFSSEFEPVHVFTAPGYYNVKLKVTGDGGETFYYRTFRVFQNPIADFAVYPNRVMLPDANVHIYNLTKYGDRYEWDLGDGSPLLMDRDPVYTYKELGEFRVSLRAFAADSLGACQDFTTKFPAVWVEGIGKIDFPNAFIPSKTGSNGGLYDDIDYKNEVFHPVHYGVVEYELMVFNRWGEQIFQSKDVKVGWDGYFQGRLCDQGVYIWRSIGKFTNGRAFDKKGNVTLLR